MVKYLKNRFALTHQGAKELIKGIIYSALFDFCLMLPVGLVVLLLDQLIKPILGEEFETPGLWFYVGMGVLVLLIMGVINWLQYTSVYVTTYNESANRRISLAEKLRKLPLSYFGKNLSDLTNTIMGDCADLERLFLMLFLS